MKKFTLFSLVLLSSFFLFGQNIKKSEKTVHKFMHALGKNNFQAASKYTILDAKNMFSAPELIYSYSGENKLKYVAKFYRELKIIRFEFFEGEYGVECLMVTSWNGNRFDFNLHLTLVDNKWFIYYFNFDDVDFQEMDEDGFCEIKEMKTKPSEIVLNFIRLHNEGQKPMASEFTFFIAKKEYESMGENHANTIPVVVLDINCAPQRKGIEVNCVCTGLNQNADTIVARYGLTIVNKEWKIFAFGSGRSPNAVVTSFTLALNSGDCQTALSLTTSVATDNVLAAIDAGCASSPTEILSTECTTSGNKARCTCTEKRDGMEMTFVYDLTKTDNGWLVSNYQKDLGLDMGTSEDSLMQDMYAVDDENIYETLDTMPQFPGGQTELEFFIANELRYPEVARKSGLEGTVIVGFIVDPYGEIYDITLIKGMQKSMDEEAIRVVKTMPLWNPGQKNGKFVHSKVQVSINYKI
ncbi:MAG: energy transducer TonB [Crocinitomicaceae bacterium]|nr:energy transducer TonB [Crocinitomicaceae bacterium]MBK8927776.1 energy transducer TonB [Crocinitomicaceae bacterium]